MEGREGVGMNQRYWCGILVVTIAKSVWVGVEIGGGSWGLVDIELRDSTTRIVRADHDTTSAHLSFCKAYFHWINEYT